MPAYVNLFNTSVAIGTILLQVVFVILCITLIFSRSKENKILVFFKDNTFLFVFLLGAGGLLLSLFYSEIIGYPACELCWKQRFFIYPQAFIFGFLVGKPFSKFKNIIVRIGIMLAVSASLISILHIYVENGGATGLGCASDALTAITCSARYVYEFGYITIPVMALTTSLLILLLLINYRYVSNNRAILK